MAPLVLNTPAKTNLFLDITGKRADGYHELLTVFLPLPELSDQVSLEIVPREGIELACTAVEVPVDKRNLVWRAAQAFAAAAHVPPTWRFRIEKRIPVAGGLGGGSSDAAAALLLLNRAHGDILTKAILHELAAQLGADVPFFLNPVPAVATGIGDVLRPIPCAAPLELVVVNPGFPIATAWAYRHWADVPRPTAPKIEALLAALAAGDPVAVAAHSWNVLEPAVCHKFPLLAMLLEGLRDEGCLAAHVSGSGASVYGICAAGRAEAVKAGITGWFEMPLRVFALHGGNN